jgi:hypothetical protein
MMLANHNQAYYFNRLMTYGIMENQRDGGSLQNDTVIAGETSDPFLMAGFYKKTVHLKNDGTNAVEFNIEVDFLGKGEWNTFKTIKVNAHEYSYFTFPDGYNDIG